jgi:GMP synthase (glutamine-hydrolysing)
LTIVIVNNYSKEEDLTKVNKIADALRRAGKSKILVWNFPEIKEKENLSDLEAIILSGSSAHLQNPDHYAKYEAEVELVRQVGVPILGICFGHQLIGIAFGSKLYSEPDYTKDFKPIEILEPNGIFSSWQRGDILTVNQYHKDFLSELPKDFVCLAKSQSCEVEAMRHQTEPIYGIQAHVERASNENPDGNQIIRNFIENVVEKYPVSRIVNTKSFHEIKQGIIDSLRNISYDVIREDCQTVESKLKKAQRYVEALELKKVTDALCASTLNSKRDI